MSTSNLSREKALGSALILLVLVVAIAVIASSVVLGQWRDPEFVDLAGDDPPGAVEPSGSKNPARFGGAPKSLATTASIEATGTEATSSAGPTTTASAATTDPSERGPSAWAPSAPSSSHRPAPTDVPATPDSPGTSGSPGHPSGPVTPDPSTTSEVRGRVHHQVWGTPLADVSVRLSPFQRTASSGGSGTFTFAGVPDGQIVTVAISGSEWLSHGPMRTTFFTPHAGAASFGIYHASEALGRDWRSATSWRSSAAGDLVPAVAKVSAASSVFRGISASRAATVLGWSKSGTPEQRAHAELLATWLDLASGRLGFDTRVSTSQVSGAGAMLPTSTSVLGLVRSAEYVIGSRDRIDWNVLRRTLTERVLAY